MTEPVDEYGVPLSGLDGLRTLDKALSEVDRYVAPGRGLPRVASEERPLVLVASALLRSAAQQARAVRVLAESPIPHTAAANTRSVLEATAELYHLLHAGDAIQNGQYAYCWAHLEAYQMSLTMISTERPGGWSTIVLSGNEAKTLVEVVGALAALGHEYPSALRAMVEKRNGWHGERVSGLVTQFFEAADAGAKTVGRTVYKGLSWEAHHSLAVLRFVDGNVYSPAYGTFTEDQTMDNAVDFLPWMTAELLNLCAGMHWQRWSTE